MIRDILYLDTERLYSLSSQLFEGVTESVVRRASEASDKSTQQEGPRDSGRLLADIMSNEQMTEWRGVLHDHALTLFEAELRKRSALLDLRTAPKDEPLEEQLRTRDLVLVVGRARLIDYMALDELVKKFNKLAGSLAYVMSSYNGSSVTLRSKAQQSKKPGDQDRVLEAIAKEMNLGQDQVLLDSLRFLLQHGFADYVELRVAADDGWVFTVPLSERWMRQSRQGLVKRSSRFPQFDICVLGLVSQVGPSQVDFAVEDKPESPRRGFDGLLVAMERMDETMMPRDLNEVVVDPIAVYRQLSIKPVT